MNSTPRSCPACANRGAGLIGSWTASWTAGFGVVAGVVADVVVASCGGRSCSLAASRAACADRPRVCTGGIGDAGTVCACAMHAKPPKNNAHTQPPNRGTDSNASYWRDMADIGMVAAGLAHQTGRAPWHSSACMHPATICRWAYPIGTALTACPAYPVPTIVQRADRLSGEARPHHARNASPLGAIYRGIV